MFCYALHADLFYSCNGNNVSAVIQGQKKEQDLCILPTTIQSKGCGTTPKHDETKLKARLNELSLVSGFDTPIFSKEKRTISPSEEPVIGPDQEPSIQSMMEAVMNGEFTFQYTNVIRIADSNAQTDLFPGPLNQQQGILEMAWLLSEDNNPGHVNANYQEFGGTDLTARPPPDMFLVMHFHVDHILHDDSGNAYVGIYAYNAFVSHSNSRL